jgi:hypothetical protein
MWEGTPEELREIARYEGDDPCTCENCKAVRANEEDVPLGSRSGTRRGWDKYGKGRKLEDGSLA